MSYGSFSISKLRKCNAISRFLTGVNGKQCFAWSDFVNIVIPRFSICGSFWWPTKACLKVAVRVLDAINDNNKALVQASLVFVVRSSQGGAVMRVVAAC